MPKNTPKASSGPAAESKVVEAPQAVVSEADFDDSIARNRALALIAPDAVPAPTSGFRPTDSSIRKRRLRRLADATRAEGLAALNEAAQRDLKKDLGKYAPDPQRASVLAERMVQTGALVLRAQRLYNFAKEMDEIALSDGLVFLEAENKEFVHAVEREPDLVDHYAALKKLFALRGAAISEGIARSKKADEEADEEEAEGADA